MNQVGAASRGGCGVRAGGGALRGRCLSLRAGDMQVSRSLGGAESIATRGLDGDLYRSADPGRAPGENPSGLSGRESHG